jgi:hypothetical protein
MSSDPPAPAPITALDLDRGATRLLDVIEARCEPAAPFEDRLRAALRVTVALLLADRELADLLLGEDPADPLLWDARRHWRRLFAERLRDAAAASPGLLRHPDFFEPFLIGAVAFLLHRRLDSARREGPEQLVAALLELPLACYAVPASA